MTRAHVQYCCTPQLLEPFSRFDLLSNTERQLVLELPVRLRESQSKARLTPSLQVFIVRFSQVRQRLKYGIIHDDNCDMRSQIIDVYLVLLSDLVILARPSGSAREKGSRHERDGQPLLRVCRPPLRLENTLFFELGDPRVHISVS